MISKELIDMCEVFIWSYRHYPLINCLCGTVDPWMKVPKSLEKDTLMWVYGVGPAPGFWSLKTRGWSYLWIWVPKDTGYDLPLGDSPKIVIIILTEYLVEHWYLMCTLVGVTSLLVVKGWMRKSRYETNKQMHTCLTLLHIC